MHWPGTLFFFTFTSDDVLSSINGPLVSFQAETDKWWTRLWTTALDRRIFRSHYALTLRTVGSFTTLTLVELSWLLNSPCLLILRSVQISSPFLCLVFLKDSLTYDAKGFQKIFCIEDFHKFQEIPAKGWLKIDDSSSSMTIINCVTL